VLFSAHGNVSAYWRRVTPQRGGLVRLAILRGTWPDRIRACGFGPSSISPISPTQDSVHHFRAAHWSHARRNSTRARQASGRSNPKPCRLVAPITDMAETNRRQNCTTGTTPGRTNRMYWVRLPFTRPLRTCQPRGQAGAPRSGPATVGGVMAQMGS
jgi:hypothetical protein